MKHPGCIIIIFLFVFFPALSYASTIGSVETVGKGKVDVAVDGDYVFNRDLKAGTWTTNQSIYLPPPAGFTEIFNVDSTVTKPKIDHMYSSSGKISYGLFDDLDVYLKLGTDQKQITGSFGGTGSLSIPAIPATSPATYHDGTFKYATDNAFTWGGGLKITHHFEDGWLLGCVGQYIREKNGYKASSQYLIDISGLGRFNIPAGQGWQGQMTTQEWLIAPYIAKRICRFTPYIGFTYSVLNIKDKSEVPVSFTIEASDLSAEGYTLKYKNKNSVAPFCGTDIKITDHFDLNVEGRFVDETALSLSGNYTF